MLQNLTPLIPYRVTRGSTDGHFQQGDLLWVSENGEVHNITSGLWMECLDDEDDFEAEHDDRYEVVHVRDIDSEVIRPKNVVRFGSNDPRKYRFDYFTPLKEADVASVEPN